MLRLIVLICLVLAASAQAFANQNRTTSATSSTAPGDPFAAPAAGDLVAERRYLEAVEGLLTAGDVQGANFRLRAFVPSTPFGRVMHSFLSGMEARSRGQLQEAADRFRGILNDYPDLARVRGALAETLFMQNEDDAARHHLELLRPMAAGNDAEGRINAAIAALDDRRPWSANLSFGLAPSTNINNGTNAREFSLFGLPFQVSENSRAKSGLGLSYGGDVGYRWNVIGGLDIVAAGFAQVRDFQNIFYDQVVFGGQVGPRFRFENGHIGVSATYLNDVRGGLTSNIKNGVRVYGSYRFGQLELAPDFEYYGRRFPLAPLFSVNGWTSGLTAAYSLNSSFVLRASASYGEDGAPVAENSSRSMRIGGGFFADLPLAVSLFVDVGYRRVNYNGMSIFGSVRADNRYDATVRITKRDWILFGFAPQLEYTYNRIDSNQAIFGQETHGVSLLATRRFRPWRS